MRPLLFTLAAEVLLLMSTTLAGAVTVTPAEMREARLWAAAKFDGQVLSEPPAAMLTVLANNDPVQRNSRNGQPMRIVDKQYTRGLYCHAVSKVIAHLPGPAKTFEAIIGVDSNDNTRPGRGSVVFSVTASGQERWHSALTREGMPGVPIKVDLAGASEITLEVSDGGDGISCDQSDWADARVTLADGQVLWLGELPLGAARHPYTTDPPFSFKYDGKPFADILAPWKVERSTRRLDAHRSERLLTYTDPATGLTVRCVGVVYDDFPTVEWTAFLKNTGAADTPIISDLQAFDCRFERNAEGEFTLHHHTGSPCKQSDYEPFATTLAPRQEKRFANPSGRPSDSVLPYFNLEWPGEGLVVAVGWPGQWAARYTRDEQNGIRIVAGQELTHFKLHPGEEVRTPLIALQFYKGDAVRAQNVWRQWMLAHSCPRPGGKLMPSHHAACSSHEFGEMISANEANQKLFVDRYLSHGLKLDYWWMDAGWYINETGWPHTGTWEVDPKRFPRGLRAISDDAHAKDVNIIVWFEPERVAPNTWLYDKHPEWLLGANGGQKLLNLGNPEARQWLTDHVDKLLTDQGIDLYRQDFNMDPLDYWRANDAPDRQGITEIGHVTGYLAYWDELRRRHPNMLIDSCASGGRRNDLETLRRAVPLLRSDYIFEPVGQQCHTYGIASWMPLYGSGMIATDPYTVRSVWCPYLNSCWDVRREDLDYPTMRRLIGEWREIAPYFTGDYYPLTTYRPDGDVWMAWQFHRLDLDGGFIQAFRRPDSTYESARFRLQGLAPEAKYVVTDTDAPARKQQFTGKDLMDPGLLVTLPARPAAATIIYKRAGRG